MSLARVTLRSAALLVVVATAAHAQRTPRAPAGARAARVTGLATVSPVNLLFGGFAADAEVALTRELSLGLQGSYSGANSFTGTPRRGNADRDVSAVVRYYLAPSAPLGTSVGVSGGALVAERTRSEGGVATRRQVTMPTVGLSLDFNQTFGPSRRLVLGTGTGIRRRFVGSGRDFEGVSDQQWLLRLNVGYAW